MLRVRNCIFLFIKRLNNIDNAIIKKINERLKVYSLKTPDLNLIAHFYVFNFLCPSPTRASVISNSDLLFVILFRWKGSLFSLN